MAVDRLIEATMTEREVRWYYSVLSDRFTQIGAILALIWAVESSLLLGALALSHGHSTEPTTFSYIMTLPAWIMYRYNVGIFIPSMIFGALVGRLCRLLWDYSQVGRAMAVIILGIFSGIVAFFIISYVTYNNLLFLALVVPLILYLYRLLWRSSQIGRTVAAAIPGAVFGFILFIDINILLPGVFVIFEELFIWLVVAGAIAGAYIGYMGGQRKTDIPETGSPP